MRNEYYFSVHEEGNPTAQALSLCFSNLYSCDEIDVPAQSISKTKENLNLIWSILLIMQ